MDVGFNKETFLNILVFSPIWIPYYCITITVLEILSALAWTPFAAIHAYMVSHRYGISGFRNMTKYVSHAIRTSLQFRFPWISLASRMVGIHAPKRRALLTYIAGLIIGYIVISLDATFMPIVEGFNLIGSLDQLLFTTFISNLVKFVMLIIALISTTLLPVMLWRTNSLKSHVVTESGEYLPSKRFYALVFTWGFGWRVATASLLYPLGWIFE